MIETILIVILIVTAVMAHIAVKNNWKIAEFF